MIHTNAVNTGRNTNPTKIGIHKRCSLQVNTCDRSIVSRVPRSLPKTCTTFLVLCTGWGPAIVQVSRERVQATQNFVEVCAELTSSVSGSGRNWSPRLVVFLSCRGGITSLRRTSCSHTSQCDQLSVLHGGRHQPHSGCKGRGLTWERGYVRH